jgi:hypothetical protein
MSTTTPMLSPVKKNDSASLLFTQPRLDLMLRGWSREFDNPIDLPPLEDAGNYITKLPKAEHAAPELQDAMEILMLSTARSSITAASRRGSPTRP